MADPCRSSRVPGANIPARSLPDFCETPVSGARPVLSQSKEGPTDANEGALPEDEYEELQAASMQGRLVLGDELRPPTKKRRVALGLELLAARGAAFALKSLLRDQSLAAVG